MSQIQQNSNDHSKNTDTGINLHLATDGGRMGKAERKRQVLGLLVESGLDLPPAVIFHNLKRRGATFERRSVDNYLAELRDEGYVTKTDDSKGYYSATEKGRDHYRD
jgi:DNA-binding PadR family transcriptional regulator